jgi:hypothetical protein
MRLTFNEVAIRPTKTVKCAGGCGRRLKRTTKIFQTINPFNKTADGAIKTREDIYTELYAKATAWKAEPEICKHCADKDMADLIERRGEQ